MGKDRMKRQGFTLVEICVAATVLIIAITMAMSGFYYVIRGARQQEVQDELDIDVQTAMERIKCDLRLSALDKMFYYPAGAGPYTAISFPLARDNDDDGVVDLDPVTGKVIWDKTMIFHVWNSAPNQLRLTTLDPRNNTLTEVQRQAQLNAVVTDGDGATAKASGEIATTRVIFENLFDWNITPQSSTYDGYDSTLRRDINVNLGSAVLSDGPHTFKFTLTGKNPDNTSGTGYKIGLDSLFMSPSYSRREAEAHVPLDTGAGEAESGAVVEAQYMAGGSWSGNYQLYFPATAVGQNFTLVMRNDQWEDTNFRGSGYVTDNTTVEFDYDLTPYDFVVLLDGCQTNWYASQQTGTNGFAVNDNTCRGYVVRTLVKGKDMPGGGLIKFDGNRSIVYFQAGTAGDLKIEKAWIHECSSLSNLTPNATGIGYQLKFGYAAAVTIGAGAYRGSDVTAPAYFNIDQDKTYLVTYMIKSEAFKANLWKWTDPIGTNTIHSFVIITNGAASDVSDADWSAKSYIATNAIFAVKDIWTSYPTNGTYVSAIFDTRLETPAYSYMDWSEVLPSGCDIEMKARSGAQEDLSDASAWSALSSMTAPGIPALGNNRYVQYQAILTPDSDRYQTPKLKNVTIKWTGQEKLVDVGGTFTKGPDYGIFRLEVDGKELRKGVMVALEIFKDSAGYKGNKRMTSALTTEVRPRNTGK